MTSLIKNCVNYVSKLIFCSSCQLPIVISYSLLLRNKLNGYGTKISFPHRSTEQCECHTNRKYLPTTNLLKGVTPQWSATKICNSPWYEDWLLGSGLSLTRLLSPALLPIRPPSRHRRTRYCIRDSAITTIAAVLKHDNHAMTSFSEKILQTRHSPLHNVAHHYISRLST
jgi:hypothetical protein